MNSRFVKFIAMALLATAAGAEPLSNSLSGQIIDAMTNAPIYYVNVFLANTTFGTTSNANGHYYIKNIPAGSYTLVISHIGYEVATQRTLITPTSKSIVNFVLHPTVIEMDTVRIDVARDREWRRNFKVFEKEFLGYSENASACEFINPEVLRLFREEGSEELFGQSFLPLVMTHANFGYRVRIIVRSFRVTDENTTYMVLPIFEEMAPASDEQAREWADNRRSAFHGSFRHFFDALFHRQFREAGFSLEEVEDAKRFRTSTAQYDSRSADGEVYSSTDYGLIKRLHFPYYLRIRYKENWAQTSFLKLPFDTVEVDWHGNALSDIQIIRSGHWGERRFADELPLDYRPQ
ncbi:carboxypeptidase-like regulatory domain-containing protein [candidate division KSB1 bacterium]|nr:carboxypeptidase-like regulatory domain-containing protein [candidate division KSB1 bacterium]